MKSFRWLFNYSKPHTNWVISFQTCAASNYIVQQSTVPANSSTSNSIPNAAKSDLAKVKKATKAAPGCDEKILLVDDDAEIIESMRIILEAKGFKFGCT